MIKDMENEKILEQVNSAIKKAGRIVMEYYGKKIKVVDKTGENDPVTMADIESNKSILEDLKHFGYGVLSEETADDGRRLEMKRVWIIDPLDGTRDFIEKTGEFTIMIALVQQGKPILGIIYAPALDVLYYAVKGKGAFKKEKKFAPIKIRVSKRSNFSKCVMLGSRFHQSNLEERFAKIHSVKNYILRGSSLKICQIAEGKGDFNFNPSNRMQEYDLCAADIILSEAGGQLTDLDGHEFIYNKKDPKNHKGYLASNRLVHDKIIAELRF